MANFFKVFIRDFIIFSAFSLLVFMIVVYVQDLQVEDHVGTILMILAAIFFGLLIREFMERVIGGRHKKKRMAQIEQEQREMQKMSRNTSQSSTKVVPKKRRRK